MNQSNLVAVGYEHSCRRNYCWLGLALLMTTTAACTSATAQQGSSDPLEPVNRAIFEVNLTLDRYVLEPTARTYRFVTPSLVRTGISNLLSNLKAPVIATNDLLQGEPERATDTVGRFMLNTIMGVGGLFDVGGALGMPERHSEDFGQTLATYGVPEGPYLMVPILGPSNPRDLVGDVVDALINPIPAAAAVTAANTVATREDNIETFEELKRGSIDLYAATRSATRQLRADEIRNGAAPDIEDLYGDDLVDPEGSDDDAVN